MHVAADVLTDIFLMFLAAKVAGEVFERLRQPAVIGELLAGMLLGPYALGWIGVPTEGMVEAFNGQAAAQEGIAAIYEVLAELGVIILLFVVGLETRLSDILRVGARAGVVAVAGIVVPFALGFVYIQAIGRPTIEALFVATALVATSIGITARVLADLGHLQSREARIILGAAVIDDVMGLVILAVVGAAITAAGTGQAVSYPSLLVILAKAVLFLVGALVVGVRLSPVMFRFASRLQARGVLLALGLAWCFLLSWLASVIELAPIVGAFAAGLVLERVHYREFGDRGEHELEELVAPIAGFLVPVFFVVMGMRTDLASFADTRVLGLAAALTAAAVIGKQVCGLAVVGGGVDRVTVGLGMIPRGEVGLIFANMGTALVLAGTPIVTPPLYSAIVVMVIVTTLVTPPALKWSLGRRA